MAINDERSKYELDSAYVCRCHKRLKDWGAPLDHWECVDVYDVADEDNEVTEFFTCELCDCPQVRFVHVMHHDDFFENISVGCICAGIMEGDILAAKARDNEMKNRAKRKRNFPQRKWKRTQRGGLYTNYRGTQVFINHSYYNQSQLGVYVNGQAYWSYKGKPITSFLSAAYAAFELVDPVSRIVG